MKKPRTNVEPITCDFSPWSMLEPDSRSSVKVFFASAAIVITALVAFFGVVHYWR